MKRKAWVLLAAVAVLLVVCVIRRASAPSPVSGDEVRAPAATAPVSAPKPQPAKASSSPARKVSRSQSIQPAVTTAAGPAEPQAESGDSVPKVNAIVADTGNRFRALIGEALVSEGSEVDGYRVRKVQANSVWFEKDGQIWVQEPN